MKTKGCRVLSIILAAAVLAAMTEYPYSEKNNDMTELRAGYDLNLVAYSSLSEESDDRIMTKAVTDLVNAAGSFAKCGSRQPSLMIQRQKKVKPLESKLFQSQKLGLIMRRI